MDRFLANLKRQAEENPQMALVAGGALLGGVAKLLGTMVAMNNSHAWKKEVARRAMKDAFRK